MFSISVFADSKNALMDIFNTLSNYKQNILIKNGGCTVDAHSLIGVLSLDTSKPIELVMDNKPDNSFIEAVSKFVPATAKI